MIGKNMKNVDAAGNKKASPGGYVMTIEKVTNVPQKERVELCLDFAEGAFKGENRQIQEKYGFWPGRVSKSYTDKALPFFKAFIETVIKSNDNAGGLIIGDYEDINEEKLEGMLVGVVIGEREYDGNDGTRKKGLDWYNATFVTIEDIRNENYTVPELRIVEPKNQQPQATEVVDLSANFGPVNNDDIPF